MGRAGLAVMIGALLAACGAHTRAVPITMTPARALLVDVEIEGQPFALQLDTAANHTTITPGARRRLHAPAITEVRAHGAGGEIGRVDVVVLHHARIGDREIHDLPVAVIQALHGDGRSDGLLGQDVLASYVSEVDLPRRRLVLHLAADTAWRTADLVAVPYTAISGGLIRIDATLGGRAIAVVVDLGAASSIASTGAVGDQIGVTAGWSSGSDRRDVELTGLLGASIEVGELRFPAPRFIANLPVFAALPIYDRPVMILGVDALATRKLVIEPHERRIYISRRE